MRLSLSKEGMHFRNRTNKKCDLESNILLGDCLFCKSVRSQIFIEFALKAASEFINT